MGSTLQKIGLSLVVALLLAYAGYYSYKSGKLNNNLLNFRQVAAPTPSRASPSPTATPSATGKPKTSVKPSAAPAGAVLVSLLDATNSNRTAAGLPALGADGPGAPPPDVPPRLTAVRGHANLPEEPVHPRRSP